jgi:hypothetical protein
MCCGFVLSKKQIEGLFYLQRNLCVSCMCYSQCERVLCHLPSPFPLKLSIIRCATER